MHAAAVAATAGLELWSASPERAESALGWVSHYGQHLTIAFLCDFPKPLLELAETFWS